MKLTKLLAAFIIVVCFGPIPRTNATLIELGLDTPYTESTTPASSITPWLTATLEDFSGGPFSGKVQLTLEATNLTGTEAVKTWLFSLDPALNASLLSFQITSRSGQFTDPTFSATNDSLIAGGGIRLDLGTSFATAPPPQRFTAGDSLTVLIGSTEGSLSVDNFLHFSSANSGTFVTVAHIIAIGPNGENSTWIGAPVIPEFETFFPVIGLLAAIGASRFVRRRR